MSIDKIYWDEVAHEIGTDDDETRFNERLRGTVPWAEALVSQANRIEELEAKLEKIKAGARRDGMLAASAIANRTTPPDADFNSVWSEYEHGIYDAQKAIAAAIRAEAEGET